MRFDYHGNFVPCIWMLSIMGINFLWIQDDGFLLLTWMNLLIQKGLSEVPLNVVLYFLSFSCSYVYISDFESLKHANLSRYFMITQRHGKHIVISMRMKNCVNSIVITFMAEFISINPQMQEISTSYCAHL